MFPLTACGENRSNKRLLNDNGDNNLLRRNFPRNQKQRDLTNVVDVMSRDGARQPLHFNQRPPIIGCITPGTFVMILMMSSIASTFGILLPSPFISRRHFSSFTGLPRPYFGSHNFQYASHPFGYRTHQPPITDVNQHKHERLKDNVMKKLLLPTESRDNFSNEQDEVSEDYLPPKDDFTDDGIFNPTASQEKTSSPFIAEKLRPQSKIGQGILMKSQTFKPNDLPSANQVYNSYEQFNPGRFEENSPQWQIAMLHYLIDMKKHGDKLQEASLNKELTHTTASLEDLKGNREGNPNLLQNFQEENIVDGENNMDQEDTVTAIPEQNGDPIICKLEPFNICYRLDKKGNMHPLVDRRPVRLIRIYK